MGEGEFAGAYEKYRAWPLNCEGLEGLEPKWRPVVEKVIDHCRIPAFDRDETCGKSAESVNVPTGPISK